MNFYKFARYADVPFFALAFFYFNYPAAYLAGFVLIYTFGMNVS